MGSGTGFGPAVISWFENKVHKIPDHVYPVAIDAGETIADLTVQYIATRGTAKSGKQGRIETEAMIDSVDNKVVSATDSLLEVHAGYHDTPFYTVFQELGTARIEAMYALTDAAEEVLGHLPKDLERALRRV